MAGVSDWLEGAREDGGLLIPADPTKHGCDLILNAEHVEVHAGDEAGAALGWDELDSIYRPLDGLQRPVALRGVGDGDRRRTLEAHGGQRARDQACTAVATR